MSLSPGTQIGAIEILGLLGVGGMGEVYRGRDTKLGREVAVKSLPDLFARDAERRARFQREAQVLASLNHPNIASIHDLREHDGAAYLVLELVEGHTLADRIADPQNAGRGLPVLETLDIARQMAEALEAAHARGIVHRDLKPANIKLSPEGVVKVLDFGLAKVDDTSVLSDSSHSPTLSLMHSAAGVILGTAPYMSPEQARGKPVDRRTDIWSFGCILYEMLAGQRAFAAGETTSDTLAGVLTREPDWSALPADTPPRIRRLIELCLRKDVRRRLRDIGDAHIEIVDTTSEPTVSADVATPASSARLVYTFAGLALIFAMAAAWFAWNSRSTTAPAVEPVRFDVLPENTLLGAGTIGHQASAPFPMLSPDGRMLAYVASSEGRTQLWLHRLSMNSRQALPGTAGAMFPFWSPRSDAVAFFADGQLKRVSIGDGSIQVILPRLITSATGFSGLGVLGGSWNQDDVILLGQEGGPLLRVSARGGTPTSITQLDSTLGETAHQYPHFLPDGRHFTYVVRSATGGTRFTTYVGALDSVEREPLPNIHGPAQYSAGHLFFVREQHLWAQPFDLEQRTVTGEAIQVAQRIGVNVNIGPFSVSSGALAYRAVYGTARSRLTWLDRSGRESGPATAEGDYRNIDLSPDNRFVAFQAGQPPDIWVLDLETGASSKLTTDGGGFPLWSYDGKSVFFRASRSGTIGIYRRVITAVAKEELVIKGEFYVNNEFPDGRFTYSAATVGGFDLWLASPNAQSPPTRLTETPFSETYTMASPNGQALAYATDETGRWEVMVQTINTGQRTPVSNAGGILPKWSHDGRELFYVAPDATMMAVPVKWVDHLPIMGPPKPVFQTRMLGGGNYIGGFARQYDVASDGRFLVQVPSGNEWPSAITVILNWRPR